jgi:hypothetical protein
MDDDRVKEKDQTGRTVGFLSAEVTHGTQHETLETSRVAYTRSRIPGRSNDRKQRAEKSICICF